MKVVVDNRVRVSGASDSEDAALRELASHPNPARADLARLRASLAHRPFDRRLRAQVLAVQAQQVRVTTWLRDEDGALSLPRGMRGRLPLGSCAVPEVRVSDGDPELRPARPWVVRREPRPYQARFVEEALRAEQGIYRAATGSGKTLALLMVAARAGVPTLVIVPSQALLEQWVAVAVRELGLRAEDVGAVGGGVERIRPLTVATVDSLAADGCARARRYARSFGALLFDEVYGAAARTRFDVVDCSAARYRLAAGDDERRKDDFEFLTYDAFGGVIDAVPRREAEAAGAIVPVRVRLVETDAAPPAWWSALDPAARAARHTELVRHLEEDPDRAALCAALVVRAAAEGQALVFAHHVDHVRRLCADALGASSELRGRAGFFLGGQAQRAERRETTVRLEEGACRAAFATYKALGKGVDLPGVSRAVLATPVHGNRDGVNQVLGRLCRAGEGKRAPEAVVLYDWRIFGAAPVRAYAAGGREVVVERPGGNVVPAREYLQAREEQIDAAKRATSGRAADFFRGL